MIVLGFIISNYFNSYKTYHLKQKNQELKDELSNFIQKNLSLESKLKENDKYKDVPIHDIYDIKSSISEIQRIVKESNHDLNKISDTLNDTKYMIYQLHTKHYKD